MPPSSIAEGGQSRPRPRPRPTIRTLSESGVQYGLMAYAFFLPFAKLSHVLEYAFLSLLIIWVVLKASQKELALHLSTLGLPILMFLGWVLITTAFASDPSYSFAEWRKSVTRVLMFFFVASAISEERQVRNILLACVLGCIVQAVGALHSSMSRDLLWHGSWHREGGWTSSSQWLSTYLVMILPFVYLALRFEPQQIVRWGYVLGSVLILTALFLSHTRAAWVALIVQLLVLCALRIRRSGVHATVAGALAVALVVLLTAIPGPFRNLFMQERFASTHTMQIRFNTWELAIDQIAMRPVTGLGYGRHSFQSVVPENPPEPLHSHVHNSFLSAAVQVGIPGFVLMVWILGRLLRECLQVWRASADRFEGQLALAVLLSVVGVIVRNFFDDMFVGTLVYLFWLLVGLHFALKKGRAASDGQSVAASTRALE